MNVAFMCIEWEHEFGVREDGVHFYKDREAAKKHADEFDGQGAPGQYWTLGDVNPVEITDRVFYKMLQQQGHFSFGSARDAKDKWKPL